MRIDDQWCQEALEIVNDVQSNVLVTSLNRQYNYDECRQFDLIASCTTGTDHIDNRDVPLLCLRGSDVLTDVWATAEHTLALIMSLVRRIPWAFDDVKQGNWDREVWQGTELRGKTLGIVGYGRVGQQVARFAEAFGMRVIECDKENASWECIKSGNPGKWISSSLKKALKQADIITVHVPLNAETKGMFGIEQFRMMKPTAYFINTSRSQIVNGDALYHALLHDVIAGAAIDVAESYSKETMLNLRHADECGLKLIITPHVAGNTAESRKKTQCFIASKIANYIKESAK